VDLDEMISRATAEIDEAEAQLRAAQARLGELVTIRDRLLRAEQRYAPGGTSPAMSAPPVAAAPAGTALPASLADASALVLVPGQDGGGAQEQEDTEAAQEIPQTDLCITALGEFTRPATALQIRDKLAEAGYELTRDQVRSALGYLLRKKRVARTKPGLWRLPRPASPRLLTPSADAVSGSGAGEPAPFNSFGPAASTTGPEKAGESGTSSQGGALTGAGLNSHPTRQAPF